MKDDFIATEPPSLPTFVQLPRNKTSPKYSHYKAIDERGNQSSQQTCSHRHVILTSSQVYNSEYISRRASCNTWLDPRLLQTPGQMKRQRCIEQTSRIRRLASHSGIAALVVPRSGFFYTSCGPIKKLSASSLYFVLH